MKKNIEFKNEKNTIERLYNKSKNKILILVKSKNTQSVLFVKWQHCPKVELLVIILVILGNL